MSQDVVEEASKDAENLFRRVHPDDYASLKLQWQKKNFYLIAFILKRYGIDFKGLTYMEVLVDKLIKLREEK